MHVSLEELLLAAALLITVGGVVFRQGRVETKIRESQAQSKKDLDGLGGKHRKMVAELIIQQATITFGKYDANFAFFIRRLLG